MDWLLSNTIIISLIEIKISVISPKIAPNKTHFGMDSMVQEMFHNVLQSKCVITFRV